MFKQRQVLDQHHSILRLRLCSALIVSNGTSCTLAGPAACVQLTNVATEGLNKCVHVPGVLSGNAIRFRSHSTARSQQHTICILAGRAACVQVTTVAAAEVEKIARMPSTFRGYTRGSAARHVAASGEQHRICLLAGTAARVQLTKWAAERLNGCI